MVQYAGHFGTDITTSDQGLIVCFFPYTSNLLDKDTT